MLRREDELRLCAATQAQFKAYRLAGRGEEGMGAVVAAVQRQVCAEFGVAEAVGVAVLQCAEALLPGDAEVIQLSLYRRHNRCVDGALRVGDAAPDVGLVAVSPSAVTLAHDLAVERTEGTGGRGEVGLHALLSRGRPLVVVAGSYT